MREEIFENPRTFFVIVLYCTKRRCSQRGSQLKFKIKKMDTKTRALKDSYEKVYKLLCL